MKQLAPAIELQSTPCPWCGKTIGIGECRRRGGVGNWLSCHLYVGGLNQPRKTTCRKKYHFYFVERSIQEPPVSEKSEEVWIEENKQLWRAKSPNCRLLTDKELKRRQRKAGRDRTPEERRRGGLNQYSCDKSDGGLIAMHNRWHVKRGVKKEGCDLCFPKEKK